MLIPTIYTYNSNFSVMTSTSWVGFMNLELTYLESCQTSKMEIFAKTVNILLRVPRDTSNYHLEKCEK